MELPVLAHAPRKTYPPVVIPNGTEPNLGFHEDYHVYYTNDLKRYK